MHDVMIAFYNTAQLMVSWVLFRISKEAGTSSWERELLSDCASLLALAEALQGPNLGGVVPRLALSLRLVARLSPDVQQHTQARNHVERWLSDIIWGDFCSGVAVAMDEDRKSRKAGKGNARKTKIEE